MSPLKNSQIEQIAEFNHEVGRLFRRIFLKDVSVPVWASMDDIEKVGVKKTVKKALEVHKDLQESRGPFGAGGNPYSALHDYWMAAKLKAGWRYGTTKDVATKQHPRLLPFDELSIKHVMKTVIFYDGVRRLFDFHNDLEDEKKENKC